MAKRTFTLFLLALLFFQCGGPPAPLKNSFQWDGLAKDEQRLWKTAEKEQQRIAQSGWIYQDSLLTQYVNEIAQRLLPEESKANGLTIRVIILRNPLLNAFAYPNGIIYLHTSFLAKMENEAQLAALLGHEMTHVLFKHAIKNVRNIKSKTAFFATLQLIGMPFGVYGSLINLLGSLGTMASISGYSQDMEAMADRQGLQLMVNAGYDPQQALKLFQLLDAELKELEIKEPFFFGSHPHVAARIASYEHLLQTEFAGKSGQTNETRYRQMTRKVVVDNAMLDLAMGRFKSTQRILQHHLKYFPDDGWAYYCLAESYRQRNEKDDWQQAIKYYQMAIEKEPQLADPHKRLGLIYLKQNQKQKARAEFDRYLELAPQATDRSFILEYLKETGD